MTIEVEVTEVIVNEPPIIEIEIIEEVTSITIQTLGIQGPAGPAGSSAFVFTQASPSSTWTINHNLGVNPICEVFSVGGVNVIATVTNTSLNQTIITFASPQAGSARLI